MTVRTSYFAKVGNHTPEAVGIVALPPRFYTGLNEAMLAPTKKMLFGGCTKEDYWHLLEQRGITPEWVLKEYDGKILVCFEKDVHECHRGWLAEWIFNKTGVKVEEAFQQEPPPPPPEPLQMELLF